MGDSAICCPPLITLACGVFAFCKGLATVGREVGWGREDILRCHDAALTYLSCFPGHCILPKHDGPRQRVAGSAGGEAEAPRQPSKATGAMKSSLHQIIYINDSDYRHMCSFSMPPYPIRPSGWFRFKSPSFTICRNCLKAPRGLSLGMPSIYLAMAEHHAESSAGRSRVEGGREMIHAGLSRNTRAPEGAPSIQRHRPGQRVSGHAPGSARHRRGATPAVDARSDSHQTHHLCRVVIYTEEPLTASLLDHVSEELVITLFDVHAGSFST